MNYDDNLTIESVAKKFESQFDMVNHAIKLIVNMIHTHRPARVKTVSKNPAAQVIAEMRAGKDYLEEIKPETERNEGASEHTHKVKGYSTFKTNMMKD